VDIVHAYDTSALKCLSNSFKYTFRDPNNSLLVIIVSGAREKIT